MGEKIKEFLKFTDEIIHLLEKLMISLISLMGWVSTFILAIIGIIKLFN
ncbi:hypothetical protein IRP63_13810 (plasmid) [Clostridium botulinum]|nr:hypothetical protein [Clostridium botulinum]MCD3232634.1 hypothetical protein [Clostridium botulinum D/C]MCD3238437.1 hypothetical protein [Clostridium botulinum D/C]MCD3266043.1 hypothetical protein [Clostridium botulinum D/C]MCD3304282.1 hypothetical protein [Clostridium botulinum D/C]MCD3313032.1 hypothetical protein [Clostridium botulinum D/C]